MSFSGVSIGQLIRGEAKAIRSADCGYSRLKGIFKRNLNYQNYDEFVSTAKNKIIGNLPDDILGAAIKTPDKRVTILKIQDGFAKAAESLRNLETIRLKYANNTVLQKSKLIAEMKNKSMNPIKLSERFMNTLVPKAIGNSKYNEAAQQIKESMYSILPKNTKVKLSYIDDGAFGYGYKIEFLDKEGKKIFKDSVLKLYKDEQIDNKFQGMVLEMVYNCMKKFNNNEVASLFKARSPNLTKEELKSAVKNYREIINQQNFVYDKKRLYALKDGMNHMHGANAEANSYAYIQNTLGHSMKPTDFNKPDMYNLEKRFSLSPFANETLQPVTKKVNLTNIGLRGTDAYSNAANTVAERIIDMGGMEIENFNLVDNTVVKYYKKIINRNTEKEQIEVLENLKRLVENPKTPNRTKIITAIDEAETYISFNEYLKQSEQINFQKEIDKKLAIFK